MLQNIVAVFQHLHSKHELNINARQSNFAIIIAKITNGIRWFSGIAFVILVGLAILAKWLQPVNELWLTAALVLADAIMIAAVLWMVLDMIPIFISLFDSQTHMFLIRQLELKHDFEQAADLHQFGLITLKMAETWLNIRIDRIRARSIYMVGGSDKVNFFVLAGSAWVVWKNFPPEDRLWEHNIYLFTVSFLGGLAIGGMLMNFIIQKLAYQKDLLTVAISQLEVPAAHI